MQPSLLFGIHALIFASALDVSTARAADTTPPPASLRAEAEAHYAQGAAAYQAGRYHEAVERFLTADRLAPSAALSFNTARAYEKLGDWARALEFYRDYLRRGTTSELEPKIRKRVGELEKTLEKRGLQQLTILSDPGGAEIHVDGRSVGTTPKTLELAPGSHALVLRKQGFVETERSVELRPNRALDVSVALSPEPPPAPSLAPDVREPPAAEPERVARDRGTSSIRPGPWITMGLGGAALIGAGVFELLRRSAHEDARSTPQANFAEYEDHYDSAESHQSTARVLAGAGGALILAGGVWALIDHRKHDGEAPRTALACGRSSCFGSVRVAF